MKLTILSRPWLVLGIGVIVGIALRATLPSNRGGLSFLWGGTFHFVPCNRVAFWICVAGAGVIALVLAAKRAAAP